MAELPSVLPEQHIVDDPEYTDYFEEQLVIPMEELFMRNIQLNYEWTAQDNTTVATMGVSSGIPREELFDHYLCEVDYDWNVFDAVSVRATGDSCAPTPGQRDEVGVGDVGAACAPTRSQHDGSTDAASRSLKATKLSELKELTKLKQAHESTSDAHCFIAPKADLQIADDVKLFGSRQYLHFEDYEKEQEDLFHGRLF